MKEEEERGDEGRGEKAKEGNRGAPVVHSQAFTFEIYKYPG